MKPFKLAKYLAVFLAPLVLIACGGGGGGGGGSTPSYVISTSTPTLSSANYPGNWTTTGTVTPPSVTAKIQTYNDGQTNTLEDGSVSKPFNQTTLSALSITDPSSYVTSSTTTYNLNWGTPDKSGPGYANLYPSASSHLGSNIAYMGVTVSGQGVVGPTLTQPSTDVLAAWNAGWTGKNQNILLIDGYSSIGACNSASTCHGITTMMTANLSAPGAGLFGLDSAVFPNVSFAGSAKNGNGGGTLASPVNINVVNASVTFANWGDCGGCGPAPTPTTYANMISSTAGANAVYVNFLSGSSSIANLNNIANAVIAKSAGNDALDSKYDVTSLALSQNASIDSRLLVVGALNKNGSVASPASIASYSNIAGSTSGIADRFVLANGNSPYSSTGVAMNGLGNSISSSMGTSYAAPLVAGYAAVVMQKFPNLTAASTSNIILDTARYDTLSCYPNCPTSTYGAGEASLSRALAPVGRLR